MLYTLTDGETEVEIIAFILDVIDHKTYNKKFGYKKNKHIFSYRVSKIPDLEAYFFINDAKHPVPHRHLSEKLLSAEGLRYNPGNITIARFYPAVALMSANLRKLRRSAATAAKKKGNIPASSTERRDNGQTSS